MWREGHAFKSGGEWGPDPIMDPVSDKVFRLQIPPGPCIVDADGGYEFADYLCDIAATGTVFIV